MADALSRATASLQHSERVHVDLMVMSHPISDRKLQQIKDETGKDDTMEILK